MLKGKILPKSVYLFLIILFSPVPAYTQAAAPLQLGTPEAPTVAPVTLPLVSAAQQLKGRALVDALRGGGYVLYMRHALQKPPRTTGCELINLTPVGEEQARRVGAAIRDLKIPIGVIRSSEPCRNLDTARLLGLGAFQVTEALNPAGSCDGFDEHAARYKQLIEVPPSGTNMLLVAHVHGSPNKSDWMQLEIAEIIVYRPDGKGTTTPIARVRIEEWADLLRGAAETSGK